VNVSESKWIEALKQQGLGIINIEHTRRNVNAVGFFAKTLELNIREEEVLRAALWLHDIAKDNHFKNYIPEDEALANVLMLLVHHIEGAELAGKILTELGYGYEFITQVKQIILKHMGPIKGSYIAGAEKAGFTEFQRLTKLTEIERALLCSGIEKERKNELTKYIEELKNEFPKPKTILEKIARDIDLLDLAADGVTKIVYLQQTNPAWFKDGNPESIEESFASAVQSAQDVRLNLYTQIALQFIEKLISRLTNFQEYMDKNGYFEFINTKFTRGIKRSVEFNKLYNEYIVKHPLCYDFVLRGAVKFSKKSKTSSPITFQDDKSFQNAIEAFIALKAKTFDFFSANLDEKQHHRLEELFELMGYQEVLEAVYLLKPADSLEQFERVLSRIQIVMAYIERIKKIVQDIGTFKINLEGKEVERAVIRDMEMIFGLADIAICQPSVVFVFKYFLPLFTRGETLVIFLEEKNSWILLKQLYLRLVNTSKIVSIWIDSLGGISVSYPFNFLRSYRGEIPEHVQEFCREIKIIASILQDQNILPEDLYSTLNRPLSSSSLAVDISLDAISHLSSRSADENNKRHLAQLFERARVMKGKEDIFLVSDNLGVRIKVQVASSKFEFVSVSNKPTASSPITSNSSVFSEDDEEDIYKKLFPRGIPTIKDFTRGWDDIFGVINTDLVVDDKVFYDVRLASFLARNIPIKKGDRLLDFGTGSGVLAIYVARKSAGEVSVVAVDVDEVCCRQAEWNVGRFNLESHIRVIQSDGYKELEKEERFNTIVFAGPPYTSKKSETNRSVRDFKGMVIELFLSGAERYLLAGGKVILLYPDNPSSIKIIKRLGLKYGLIITGRRMWGDEQRLRRFYRIKISRHDEGLSVDAMQENMFKAGWFSWSIFTFEKRTDLAVSSPLIALRDCPEQAPLTRRRAGLAVEMTNGLSRMAGNDPAAASPMNSYGSSSSPVDISSVADVFRSLRRMRMMFKAYRPMLSEYGQNTQRGVELLLRSFETSPLHFNQLNRAEALTNLMPNPQRISLSEHGPGNWFNWFDLSRVNISRNNFGSGCIEPCQICSFENIKSRALNYPLPIVIEIIRKQAPKKMIFGWRNNELFYWCDPFFQVYLDGVIEYTIRTYPQVEFFMNTRGPNLDDLRATYVARKINSLTDSYPILTNNIFSLSFHLCLSTPEYDIVRGFSERISNPQVFEQMKHNYIKRYVNVMLALGQVIQNIVILSKGISSFFEATTQNVFEEVQEKYNAIIRQQNESKPIPDFRIVGRRTGQFSINKSRYLKSVDFVRRVKEAINKQALSPPAYAQIIERDQVPQDNVPKVGMFKSGKIIVQHQGKVLIKSSLEELDPYDEFKVRSSSPLADNDQISLDLLKKHLMLPMGNAASLECQEALEYIERYFKALGLSSSRDNFTLPTGGESFNVIGELKGQKLQYIYVTAHADTYGIGFGANDNRSGIAVLLELARILSGCLFEYSIKFIAFSAEETIEIEGLSEKVEGRIGSKSFVKKLNDDKDNVIGVVNIDSVGVRPNWGLKSQDVLVNETSYQFGAAFVQAIENSGFFSGIKQEFDTYFLKKVSDHYRFWEAGIPALLITGGAAWFGNGPNDVSKRVDFEYLQWVAEMTLKGIAGIAGAKSKDTDSSASSPVEVLADRQRISYTELPHYRTGLSNSYPSPEEFILAKEDTANSASPIKEGIGFEKALAQLSSPENIGKLYTLKTAPVKEDLCSLAGLGFETAVFRLKKTGQWLMTRALLYYGHFWPEEFMSFSKKGEINFYIHPSASDNPLPGGGDWLAAKRGEKTENILVTTDAVTYYSHELKTVRIIRWDKLSDAMLSAVFKGSSDINGVVDEGLRLKFTDLPMATLGGISSSSLTPRPPSPNHSPFSGLRKPRLKEFVLDHIERLPGEHREVYAKLAKIFVGIKVATWIANLAGIFSGLLMLVSQQYILSAIVGGLFLFIGGICRFITILIYRYKHPLVSYRHLTHPFVFIPFSGGFAYSMLALILPECRYRDILKMRNIVYKVRMSIDYSLTHENGLSESQAVLLENNLLNIVKDILDYQSLQLRKRKNSKYQKLFRIRSAEWDEKRIYTYLIKGKPFLFIDSNERLEEIAEQAKAKFGHEYLDRLYFYDLDNLSQQAYSTNHYETRIFIRKLFPRFAGKAKYSNGEHNIKGGASSAVEINLYDEIMELMSKENWELKPLLTQTDVPALLKMYIFGLLIIKEGFNLEEYLHMLYPEARQVLSDTSHEEFAAFANYRYSEEELLSAYYMAPLIVTTLDVLPQMENYFWRTATKLMAQAEVTDHNNAFDSFSFGRRMLAGLSPRLVFGTMAHEIAHNYIRFRGDYDKGHFFAELVCQDFLQQIYGNTAAAEHREQFEYKWHYEAVWSQKIRKVISATAQLEAIIRCLESIEYKWHDILNLALKHRQKSLPNIAKIIIGELLPEAAEGIFLSHNGYLIYTVTNRINGAFRQDNRQTVPGAIRKLPFSSSPVDESHRLNSVVDKKWPTTDPKKHEPGFRYFARCHVRHYIKNWNSDYPLNHGWGSDIVSLSYLSALTPRTLREFGFLVEVPEEDVKFAHERDVGSGYRAHKKLDNLPELLVRIKKKGHRNRRDARQLLRHAYIDKVTEILVLSKNVKIVGVFYNWHSDQYVALRRFMSPYTRYRAEAVAAFKDIASKHGLPFVFLKFKYKNQDKYISIEEEKMTFAENRYRKLLLRWRFLLNYCKQLWFWFWDNEDFPQFVQQKRKWEDMNFIGIGDSSSPVEFPILNFKSHAPPGAKRIFGKTFFSGDATKRYNNIKGQVQEESTSSVAGGASSPALSSKKTHSLRSVEQLKEWLRLSLNRELFRIRLNMRDKREMLNNMLMSKLEAMVLMYSTEIQQELRRHLTEVTEAACEYPMPVSQEPIKIGYIKEYLRAKAGIEIQEQWIRDNIDSTIFVIAKDGVVWPRLAIEVGYVSPPRQSRAIRRMTFDLNIALAYAGDLKGVPQFEGERGIYELDFNVVRALGIKTDVDPAEVLAVCFYADDWQKYINETSGKFIKRFTSIEGKTNIQVIAEIIRHQAKEAELLKQSKVLSKKHRDELNLKDEYYRFVYESNFIIASSPAREENRTGKSLKERLKLSLNRELFRIRLTYLMLPASSGVKAKKWKAITSSLVCKNEGYGPPGKDWRIMKVLAELDREGKIGELVCDFGSSFVSVTYPLVNKPGRAILGVDIGLDISIKSLRGTYSHRLLVRGDIKDLTSIMTKSQVIDFFKQVGEKAPIKFTTIICSDLFNYVNYKKILRIGWANLANGGRIVISNMAGAGEKNLFDRRGVKRNSKLLSFLRRYLGFKIEYYNSSFKDVADSWLTDEREIIVLRKGRELFGLIGFSDSASPVKDARKKGEGLRKKFNINTSTSSPAQKVTKVEEKPMQLIQPGYKYSSNELLCRILLEGYLFHARSKIEYPPIFAADGPSGIRKTSIMKLIVSVLNIMGFEALYLNLDMFHKEHGWRWQIIEAIFDGDLSPMSFDEREFFDFEKAIEKMLKPIKQLRQHRQKIGTLLLRGVYDYSKKEVVDLDLSVTNKIMFIIEGKYAYAAGLRSFYGEDAYCIRFEQNRESVRCKLVQREKSKRSKKELERLMYFHDNVGQPTYERYAAETDKDLRKVHLSPEADDYESPEKTAASPVEEKQRLVEKYTPLVKVIALQIYKGLPSYILLDDLMQDGMLGLLDVIDRFDPTKGVQFKTYAAYRIKGAILDGLREMDWMPRLYRRELRRIEKVQQELERKNKRPASDEEIAEAIGLSLEKYYKLLEKTYFALISIEGEEELFLKDTLSDDGQNPFLSLSSKEDIKQLTKAIARLPKRERLVIELYYYKGLKLEEIGRIIGGLTESRASQIYIKAILKLRKLLEKTMDIKVIKEDPFVKKKTEEFRDEMRRRLTSLDPDFGDFEYDEIKINRRGGVQIGFCKNEKQLTATLSTGRTRKGIAKVKGQCHPNLGYIVYTTIRKGGITRIHRIKRGSEGKPDISGSVFEIFDLEGELRKRGVKTSSSPVDGKIETSPMHAGIKLLHSFSFEKSFDISLKKLSSNALHYQMNSIFGSIRPIFDHWKNLELQSYGVNRIQNIVWRMIPNAIDAIAQSGSSNGKIRLAIVKKKAGLILEVEDNGLGIEWDHLSRILERRFSTKDPSRLILIGGLGQDMMRMKADAEALRYSCIEIDTRTKFSQDLWSWKKIYTQKNGGRIFKSNRPDQGTIFRVAFLLQMRNKSR